MKNRGTYLLFVLLVACSGDEPLRLQLGPELLLFQPVKNNNPIRYASTAGDTIELRSLSSQTEYVAGDADITWGSLGEVESLELEQKELLFGNDSLGIEFSYRWTCSYNPSLDDQTQDKLIVTHLNFSSTVKAKMELEFSTGLSWDSSSTYYDTLKINNLIFTNCYFSENTDSLILTEGGLLGFIGEHEKLYYLIN